MGATSTSTSSKETDKTSKTPETPTREFVDVIPRGKTIDKVKMITYFSDQMRRRINVGSIADQRKDLTNISIVTGKVIKKFFSEHPKLSDVLDRITDFVKILKAIDAASTLGLNVERWIIKKELEEKISNKLANIILILKDPDSKSVPSLLSEKGFFSVVLGVDIENYIESEVEPELELFGYNTGHSPSESESSFHGDEGGEVLISVKTPLDELFKNVRSRLSAMSSILGKLQFESLGKKLNGWEEESKKIEIEIETAVRNRLKEMQMHLTALECAKDYQIEVLKLLFASKAPVYDFKTVAELVKYGVLDKKACSNIKSNPSVYLSGLDSGLESAKKAVLTKVANSAIDDYIQKNLKLKRVKVNALGNCFWEAFEAVSGDSANKIKKEVGDFAEKLLEKDYDKWSAELQDAFPMLSLLEEMMVDFDTDRAHGDVRLAALYSANYKKSVAIISYSDHNENIQTQTFGKGGSPLVILYDGTHFDATKSI